MRKNTKDKKFVVYIHKNLINSKVYIGQTCNLSERWRCNGKNYFNSIKFYNAIKKYGWCNFSHEVLYDNLSQEDADKLEKELIEKYDSIENGYNLKEGGARGSLSSESLKKMGNSVRKGFAEHPDRIEKIRQKAIGRKLSQKTKRAISLNGAKSILIDVDGDVGSLRYWELKTGISRYTLSSTLKNYGINILIERIKYKLDTGLSWTRQEIFNRKRTLLD